MADPQPNAFHRALRERFPVRRVGASVATGQSGTVKAMASRACRSTRGPFSARHPGRAKARTACGLQEIRDVSGGDSRVGSVLGCQAGHGAQVVPLGGRRTLIAGSRRIPRPALPRPQGRLRQRRPQ